MGIIDWAANKVQGFSGETERRNNVEKLKNVQQNVVQLIQESVNKLNQLINDFNSIIEKLNILRKDEVSSEVSDLHHILKRFGSVKSVDSYVNEGQKNFSFTVPSKKMKDVQEYINKVDWDTDEIFSESFKSGVLGTKKKMHQLNLDLIEQTNKLALYKQEVEKELRLKEDKTQLEIEVAQTYIQVIATISEEIKSKILPELSIINSFMVAKHIADYSNDLNSAEHQSVIFSPLVLKDTDYDSYYRFIKNAFAFYIISVKVVTTAVLTNLLNDSVTEEDKRTLDNAKQVVQQQQNKLSGYQSGVA